MYATTVCMATVNSVTFSRINTKSYDQELNLILSQLTYYKIFLLSCKLIEKLNHMDNYFKKLKNSARVAELFLNAPSIADVTM